VPVLQARYFEEEVVGSRMLDRLGDELFPSDGDHPDAAAVMHAELAQQITSRDGLTVLTIPVPFASRDELELKKVGDELIVRAGREKRAIVLPAALSRHSPTGAKLEDGKLEISFDTNSAGEPAAPVPAPPEPGEPEPPEPAASEEPEEPAVVPASGNGAGS
jgi:arsenite-transporting ATPase